MSTDTRTSSKEHFYINRTARSRFHLDDPDLLRLPRERRAAMILAERQTDAINRMITLVEGDHAEKLLPAQFHGMKVLHELFHTLIGRLSGVQAHALEFLERDASRWNTKEYLGRFLEQFPTGDIYRSEKTIDEYLQDPSELHEILEEAFLVWLNNQNPALKPFAALLSDRELRDNQAYPNLVRAMHFAIHAAGPVANREVDLAELLTLPFRHAPDSLLAQLRYIKMHWQDLLGDSLWWSLIDEAIISIEDEDRYLFFEKLSFESEKAGGGMAGEREAAVPSYADLGNAPARYSHDSSWMPEVVMLAKSTYVWLWQLSQTYGRPITRLQDIPDEELDRLAERGFTALWLIGLWQRSHASRKIKQLQGNPEAKASAYALENYNVADELGGYDGYTNLRNRAMERGIRLASDMVPNHTGIDSELVRHRPEWFLSTSEPPYPNYTYNGPNLSEDGRYGIYIEDGYWNRSDAAVTFKRVDHLTGDTRYIYHGNDGTNMPWNDTAQLNFLDPVVREGVIQQILHVARMFPVIRFDAAMVLAKMHIQRLWYPLPGHASGVPSRSAWSKSMADFEAAIPEEFWREVVDRVALEVPDTLLLAEAFWMLEGYFVRTLGMHRVYNSAFMHMLKKEDNAGYRQLIKKTLEFDAEILKRYVNFMNNPDEETAISQFGNGDKYFGVCMMMLTMPGLPMIGHGQIEGLTEKYGMEYARAYYDEQPDQALVARHEREIFPVMKIRALFAEVSNFHLFDLYSSSGSVDEGVFAYSNRLDGRSALFIYNNRYESAEGWIRISAAQLRNGSLEQTCLADALLLPHEHDAYVIFRDHRSELEFIRSCSALRENGLQVALNGYEYNLFLDFRVVRPSRLLPYDRICRELDGRGSSSIDREALSMSLSPFHQTLSAGIGRIIDGCCVTEANMEQACEAFAASLIQLLEDLSSVFGEIMEQPLKLPADMAKKAAAGYRKALTCEDELLALHGHSRMKAALGMTPSSPDAFRQISATLIVLESIQTMLLSAGVLEGERFIDQLMLAEPLSALGSDERPWPVSGMNLVDLFSCLMASEPVLDEDETPELRIMHAIGRLFRSGDRHFRNFMQLQRLHGKEWFREERMTMLLSWTMLERLLRFTDQDVQGKQDATPETLIDSWLTAFEKLETEAFLCGYEMQQFSEPGDR